MENSKIKKWRKGEFDAEKKYYIYEWFNKETNYVFYVGKGSGDRYKHVAPSKRNKYFRNYFLKHECDVRIIIKDLSEKEAFDKEIEIIAEKRKIGECCCNFDDGGAECAPHLSGELNPMFGKTHSKEAIEKIRQANLNGKNAGSNNSQFGVSPRDRMSEETYEQWIEKHKLCFLGSKNNKAKTVRMYSKEGVLFKEFGCIKDCRIFLKEFFEELSLKKESYFRNFYKKYNSPSCLYKNFYFEIIKPNKDNTVSSSRNGEDVTTNENIFHEKNMKEEVSSVDIK